MYNSKYSQNLRFTLENNQVVVIGFWSGWTGRGRERNQFRITEIVPSQVNQKWTVSSKFFLLANECRITSSSSFYCNLASTLLMNCWGFSNENETNHQLIRTVLNWTLYESVLKSIRLCIINNNRICTCFHRERFTCRYSDKYAKYVLKRIFLSFHSTREQLYLVTGDWCRINK